MPETGRGLAKFGVLGSIVWLLIAVGYSIYARAEFKELQPNEIGDFLAGVFAPLAFFWLVLGFLQQGAELRNSGQALWLQGEELRNSVEQQKQLVDVTREQLAFESTRITSEQSRARKLAQPKLALTAGATITPHGRPEIRRHAFHLVNHGATCTRLIVRAGEQTIFEIDELGRGQRSEFSKRFPCGFGKVPVEITYLDSNQDEGSVSFTILETSTFEVEISAP